MDHYVVVPDSGTTGNAVITRWLKSEGEHVVAGEPIVEIETDKASQELEAPVTGVILALDAGEGDEVFAGQRLARISPKESSP